MSNGFKIGDVVENGWAGPDNRFHVIVGRGSIKTGRYSTTSTYKSRILYKGKLVKHISQMDIKADRQTKLGHIDYEGYIEREMQKLIDNYTPEAIPSRVA